MEYNAPRKEDVPVMTKEEMDKACRDVVEFFKNKTKQMSEVQFIIEPSNSSSNTNIERTINDYNHWIEGIKGPVTNTDEFNLLYLSGQCRIHRKKRINKKWMRRYGYKKIILFKNCYPTFPK